ncbi:MAG: 1-acyl-sn-glycerol-3-phosphate acyltransferase [candidate division Zixibacteria bacterium]|nr:1-acyl-sn-glycerol-3-phosphate acyltransferase [candidate division Zixibacteria bacterium]
MTFLFYFGYQLSKNLTRFLYRPIILGQENFPADGGFILASNHISNFDPPIVGSWCPREVYFLAKKELFPNKLAAAFFRKINAIPVKRGAIDRTAIEQCIRKINEGYGMTIFPEGTRYKNGLLHPPKPGIGIIANRTRCPIIPAYIHGTNRLKECLTGRVKMLIAYGKPLAADWAASFPPEKESYIKIAEQIMNKIAALRDEIHQKYTLKKNKKTRID